MSQTSEDHPTPYRVRPRFQVETSYSVEDLAEKISIGLKKEDAPCKGKLIPGYATIYLPQKEQHYWSPQLSLTLEETENGSLLRGLYGPRPAVWTMFIFFYALICFAIFIISIVGLANLSLDKSGAILWLVPVLVVAFLSLYLVAYFGQKLGHDQMATLHKFIEESTGLTFHED